MEYVNIQGIRIPALGLGTWRLTGSQCRRTVEEALAIGYRHLDTAQMYRNEADVGAAIQAAGIDAGELFVTTKIDNGNHRPEAVRASTEESLDRLQLDAVDLLLVHQPVAVDILEDTLEAMQQLQQDGLVRHLGVSNFSVELLERALAAAPLLAIQIEYHPFRSQAGQLEAARRHDLLFQAYSPLARGGVAWDNDLEAIARDAGATAAQLSLRWLLEQPNVAVIPKASSRRHLVENWGALDVRLDDEARRRMNALTSRQEPAADVGM
jgi:2,5-diketo-D-gluconate reductase B